MRFILVVLGIVVLLGIAALMLGFVSIDQTRPAVVQAPKFEAEVGRIDVGTENRTVTVPTVDIERADNAQAQ